MVNRTYYYIKPRPEAQITFGEPTPLRLAVAAAPAMPAAPIVEPVADLPTGKIMDLDFGEKTQAFHEKSPVKVAGWVKLAALVGSVGVLYFGGIAVADAALAVKDDVTALTDQAVAQLESGADFVAKQQFIQAKDSFASAETYFLKAQEKVIGLGQTNLYLSGLAGSSFHVIAGQKLIDAGVNLAQSGELLVGSLTPALDYLNQVNAGTGNPQEYPKQIADLLTSQSATIDQALTKVTKADDLLSGISIAGLDPTYAQAIQDARTKTANLKNLVEVLATVAKELPRELGFNTPRFITVLNQNNNELRPTGGFLGSIANIRLYKGEIEKVDVDITQRIDGQNPNSPIPLPYPLTAVAWDGNFGTRDSNYYPNFATSAQTFQDLYIQGRGGTSDMIIAINPLIIEDILTIVGPIEVPGKDITFTAQNFVELSQHQIEVLDQKKENPKEVFGEFAPLLMDRVMNASGEQLKAINAALLHRLQTKDIMLHAKNKNMQEALAKLNFAGVPPATSGDFLSVIRTNLGATKSSQNVSANITHVANISLDGEVETSLKMTFTHRGSYEFPDGVNVDYIRVYTPKGSRLSRVDGYNPETKIDTFEEDGKTVFGFWVSTKPGETKNVEVNYRPNVDVKNNRYQVYLSRQPGTENTTLSSAVRLSPALSFNDGATSLIKQLFSGKFEQDLDLTQGFVRDL